MAALVKILNLLFIGLVFACTPPTANRQLPTDQSLNDSASGAGNGALPNDSTIGNGVSATNVRVEIRHLVDPFDGTYKTKLTIPKNFTGLFYLSGLNFNTLANNLVQVRFNFGQSLTPVTIPATVASGPGITGTSQISVLVMNIQDRPFNQLRLIYDLFDYNNYNVGESPVEDPRDNNLYCRGLELRHDPTFEGTSPDCSNSGDKCLYAYAKIRDDGLYNSSTNLSSRPSEPQVDLSGQGYDNDSSINKIQKCLPDNGVISYDNDSDELSLNISGALTTNPVAAPGLPVHHIDFGSVDQETYLYRGPYRALNKSAWVIGENAAIHNHVSAGISPRGLFMQEGVLGGGADLGIRSYLFPRAGSLELRRDSQYIGANSTGGPSSDLESYHITTTRSLQTLPSNGETDYVDGCNIRASNFNESSGEGIGSCNITATIQVITIDPINQRETILAETSDLKLQLTRPSLQNNEGQNFLFSSLKDCSSSATCGVDECCFNKRCVDEELVSQCLDDSQDQGNLGIGDVCSTDFDCQSLCCNSSIGRCSPHDNVNFDPPILCSKTPGQFCIAREWCAQEVVQIVYVESLGTEGGVRRCRWREIQVPTHGDCISGMCVSPTQPNIPDRNQAPNCDEAQTMAEAIANAFPSR